ncbi:MAG: ubiquinone biosynthesis protein UbiB, partial [Planctomycetes bacterium]|nr:ubiquinone biosynthesis protein UbiB [Planctomycetota bacterium]
LSAGRLPEGVDVATLRHDIGDFLDRFHGLPLEEIRVAEAMSEFFDTLRRHHIVFPPDLVLLAKALATAEAVARDLDPKLDLVTRARPFVLRMLRRRASPGEIAKEIAGTVKDLAALLRKTPADLARILDMVKRNQLRVGFRHEGLESFATEVDRSSNRLALGMIVAALIVGSSIVIQARVGPTVWDLPVLGVVGFVVAGVMGMLLALGILGSGRL